MDPSLVPLPPVEATVLLVNASPLIHRAMVGWLGLSLRFGPVIVPDAVEIEPTHDVTKPFAAEIRAWMDANIRKPGQNRWVERAATDVGELLEIRHRDRAFGVFLRPHRRLATICFDAL